MTKMPEIHKFVPFFALLMLMPVSGKADFTTIAEPTAAYVGATTLLDLPSGPFNLFGVSDGTEDLSFGAPLSVESVPNTWSTWNFPPAVEQPFPRVAATQNAPSLLIALDSPAYVFGLEISPNLPFTEEVVADFFDSQSAVGSVERSPTGDNGALLFAASTQTNPFSYIYIDDLSQDDFAVGDIRYALTPEDVSQTPEGRPSGYILLAALVMGTLFFASRSRSESRSAQIGAPPTRSS